MERLDAILLTGTIGVGKSAVLVEIGDLLDAGDGAYGLIDLDWLAWIRPPDDSANSVRDILATNLAHCARTFGGAGISRLVMARAISHADDVASIRAALGTRAHLAVVLLTAAPQVVERRLRVRDRGERLAEHLRQADTFASVSTSFVSDVVVQTDELAPALVARQVLARVGWAG